MSRARCNVRLFGEEFGLRGGGGSGGAGIAWSAAGDADDAEDFHLGESGAGNEHAEIIAVQVGRGELNTGIQHFEQVVGNDSFHHIVIAEAEADPKAVELGAAKKCLALGFKIFGKFTDKIDRFDVVESEGAVFAVGGEEVDAFRAAKRAGIQVAAGGGTVELEDDNLLESGRWSAGFDGLGR